MKDTILVVEGIPSLRKQLESFLTADYHIYAVPNYLESISALRRISPEMVIINASLPVVDGWEACREIIRDFGLPVMLLGKNNDNSCWERAFEAGADFYLKIPFSKLEILCRIKAILRRTRRSANPPPSLSRQPLIRKQA
ncbi:MAG: response regulator [Dehalococcoidales bacterium]|jgi:DNA-binding response OmpR family regulator